MTVSIARPMLLRVSDRHPVTEKGYLHMYKLYMYILIEVGYYRGLFLGHSFRSSWTPDKLVTWYLLIPFLKKKLKKVLKTRVPPPKNGGIQNGRRSVSKLTFSTFLTHFWVFFRGKNHVILCFWCQGIHFWRIY